MPPIPCAHCGNNFMRPTLDPEAPKLCNNCSVKEDRRNPQPKDNMSTVDILIKCPRDVQIEIEEYCITQGVDFTRYFLELHYGSQSVIAAMKQGAEEARREQKIKVEEENKSAKKSTKK